MKERKKEKGIKGRKKRKERDGGSSSSGGGVEGEKGGICES